MAKSNLTAISGCGRYVAAILSIKSTLEIHELYSTRLFRRYDLHQIVKRHLADNGIEKKVKTSSLVVTQLTWEEIIGNSVSSKIGLIIDNYSILLVIDIREAESEPIVIQQLRSDGIEKFQWIPPIHTSENNGGYMNSKQLGIFTKNNLQFRLYSLDCTSILLTILKPTINEVLIRSNKQNTLWSIVADTLDYSSSSIVYHFYNEGSISSLLYKFKISDNILTEFDLSWSSSGKWLCYFTKSENLFGFNIKIYNSLGVYQNDFNQVDEVPIGDPIMNIDWLTDGIADDIMRNSLISIGSVNYICKWLVLKDLECVLVGCTNEMTELELILISTKSFQIINKSVLDLSIAVDSWKQVDDGIRIRYQKVLNKSLLSRIFTLKDIVIFESLICLQFDESLFVYKLDIDNDKNEIHYELESSINLKSSIKSIQFFKNGSIKLTVIADDHISIYDFSKQSIEIVYSSKLKVKYGLLFPNKDFKIAILHESINREEFSIRNWKLINVPRSLSSEDDSNSLIMNKYQYKEDNSKVLGLIKDAKQNESRRFKRNRFDNQRLSLINSSNLDEITDTFNLHKRAKK